MAIVFSLGIKIYEPCWFKESTVLEKMSRVKQLFSVALLVYQHPWE